MHRQQTLPLDGQQSLDALWQRFPEKGRREVIQIYARLMALAVQRKPGKEKSSAKIRSEHLERKAFVYIRQSSLRQVRDHVEGRVRQYQMVDWAERAGWPKERIVVIDEDQGKSAAVAEARIGFGQLITAVGRGEGGIVVSLEVSRLARNSPDWHNLICLSRWTDTLITDGQTIYDPKRSADRMVLGIRGQVSELELDHSIQRMIDARWNKARRGELMTIPPAGYDLDDLNELVLTVDESVSQAIKTVFAKLDELGSGRQVFLWWKQQGLKYPVRRVELRTHPIVWLEPTYNMVLRTLHNPIYAGVYVFGRIETLRDLDQDNPKRLEESASMQPWCGRFWRPRRRRGSKLWARCKSSCGLRTKPSSVLGRCKWRKPTTRRSEPRGNSTPLSPRIDLWRESWRGDESILHK